MLAPDEAEPLADFFKGGRQGCPCFIGDSARDLRETHLVLIA